MAALAHKNLDSPEISGGLSYGAPAYPDIITSGAERRARGIGAAYVDEYNQMLTNQYNNAYNYWLWQQQMNYESPKAQMERYLEAGLNPHYQTVSSGNPGSIPSSRAEVRGNIRQNQLNAISNGVSIATSIASLVSRGIGAIKDFASLPASVGKYRRLLTAVLSNKATGGELSNAIKALTKDSTSYIMGNYQTDGSSTPNLPDSLWYKSRFAGYQSTLLRNAIFEKQEDLLRVKTALARYDLNNLKPMQLETMRARLPMLAAQINYILSGTGLRIKENAWKDVKEGWKMLTDIVDAIIPF